MKVILIFLSFLVSCTTANQTDIHQFNALVKVDYSACISEIADSIKIKSFSDTIIIKSYDLNQGRTLYSLENQYAPGFWKYHLIVSDGVTCSLDSIVIESTWTRENEARFKAENKLIDEPIFSLVDNQVIPNADFSLLERVHNGTIYNAVLKRYFKITHDLRIIPIFVLETKTVHPFNHCILERYIGQVKVHVVKRCQEDRNFIKIGSYAIKWSEGEPSVSDKVIIDSLYENLLITGSNTDQNRFIRSGY